MLAVDRPIILLSQMFALSYTLSFVHVECSDTIIEGKDVFVSLPTGSVKSLCYCLLPKAFDSLRCSNSMATQSIVVVVSPLMKDQVRQMTQRDISAVYVGDDDVVETKVCGGKFQLVYLSPEALRTNATWRDMLLSPMYQSYLVALAVDEAHCVKKW